MYHVAVALGTANQFRAMGGAIGLAVVTSVFNDYVGSQLSSLGIHVAVTDLASLLTHGQLALTATEQDELRSVLSDGYNYQMVVLAAFGAVQIPLALLMWRRQQVVVA